ncbi:MAG: EAL domain-containing protein [Firmicutes bacterium]|nr:EAL domain-containing protein [Bacillota bacterium]
MSKGGGYPSASMPAPATLTKNVKFGRFAHRGGISFTSSYSKQRWYTTPFAITLILGILISLLVGFGWYRAVRNQEKSSFYVQAGAAQNQIGVAFRSDMGYLEAERALVTTFPNITNRTFANWYSTTSIGPRSIGNVGFSYIVKVPNANLYSFANQLYNDPPHGIKIPFPSSYSVYPSGSRPTYCLMKLGYVAGKPLYSTEANFDYCDSSVKISPFPRVLTEAENEASFVVVPPIGQYSGEFFIVAPVYRGDVIPTSVTARQAQLTGWVLSAFSVSQILGYVAKTIPDTGIALYLHTSGQTLEVGHYHSVNPSPFSVSISATVDSTWTVDFTRNASIAPILEGVGITLLGLLLTAALVILIRMLAKTREKAYELVDERTGELKRLALHDPLTGLPNRALVIDRATQLLARTKREDIDVGVLFIDLDNFKDVNDTLGHQRGDQLLVAVASRLTAAIRPSDTVGRLGGDEFVVLLEDHSGEASPEEVAERILGILSRPFILDEKEQIMLSVRASIGVAIGYRDNADNLLRDADIALYQAKQSGKSRYKLFKPEMQQALKERMAHEMELRSALTNGEFFLEYQPVFDLKTLSVSGVEALVRWRHPQHGVLFPIDFIPFAEETGVVGEIGSYVLQLACRQAAAWANQGYPVPVSVNISGQQLDSGEIIQDVKAVLRSSKLDPSLLVLDLSEGILMRDADMMSKRLRDLKQLGVGIAIDDFGTGYSSLAYLRRLPIDTLKIDGSFIKEVAGSPEGHSLIRTLVQLGKTLGIDTLAEGIEDESQLTELQREQCDYGQGFLYSRPLTPDALKDLLDRNQSSIRHIWPVNG